MREQWDELKETIIELRDNNGTATQHECCQFLANLMNVLEAQMAPARKKGKWNLVEYPDGYYHTECSECGCEYSEDVYFDHDAKFCPNCGTDMREDGE